MKTVCKKLLSLMLVAVLLVSAMPFQASAAEIDSIPVTVIVNGSEVTPGTLNATGGVTLNADTACPAFYEPQGTITSLEWYNNSGKKVTGKTLIEGDWFEEHKDGYSLTLNITDVVTYNVTLNAYNGDTLLTSVTCSNLPAGSTINVADKISVDGYYITAVEGGAHTITVSANATYRVDMAPNTPAGPEGGEKPPVDDSPVGNTITVNFLLSGDDTIQKTVTATIGGKIPGVPSAADVLNFYAKEYGSSAGKQFRGWRDENGAEFNPSTTNIPADTYTGVEDPILNLYAVVSDVNSYSVEFQRYTNNGWEYVTSVNVPANGTVSKPTNDFSYACNGVNYKIVGWEIGETDKSFAFDSTRVNSNLFIRPRYQGTITLTAQEPVTGASWKSYTVTREIGEPIGKLTNPGARSVYAFGGWVAENGSTQICDAYCNSSKDFYPHLYGNIFYALWEGGITVNLHIHTNGNKNTATKIIPYHVAPATGEFDMLTINMYSLYSNFYLYDDDCDKIYGWYDSTEWANYCANRAAHPAYIYTDIEAHNQRDFHIMLIDNGSNGSGSGTVADSSNPKTGDAVFTPVIVMGASVTALAVLFFLNKKRAF